MSRRWKRSTATATLTPQALPERWRYLGINRLLIARPGAFWWRYGELLAALARAPESRGGDLKSASKAATPIAPSPYAQALADTGTTRLRRAPDRRTALRRAAGGAGEGDAERGGR